MSVLTFFVTLIGFFAAFATLCPAYFWLEDKVRGRRPAPPGRALRRTYTRDLASDEASFYRLVNEERVSRGLPPLAVSDQLALSARLKAEHMARHGYYDHLSPDGLWPGYFIEEAGSTHYSPYGENIASGYESSAAAFRGWMNSPGHRDAMLSGTFTELGYSVAEGTGHIYAVAHFGTPLTW